MRHIILTLDFPPHADGGVASLMEAQADGLVALGEDVTVISRRGLSHELRKVYPVVGMWGHRWLHLYRWWLHLQLPALLRRWRPEVVYVADWRLAEIPLQLRRSLGFRVVTWTHGLDLFGNYDGAEVMRRQFTLVECDRVLATHHFGERRLREMGVSSAAIRRVLPGLTHEFCQTVGDGERFRRQWALGSGPVLLTLGRLVARKGQDRVLTLLPRLVRDYPRLRYVIAGQGREAAKLQRQVEVLRLQHHVVFTGFLDAAGRADAYAGCDGVISPVVDSQESGDVEGFCITNLEAGWHRCPVVATDVGGVGDSVLPGVTGLLVNVDADLSVAIQTLLSSPDLRRVWGEGGHTRALEIGPPGSLGQRLLEVLEP